MIITYGHFNIQSWDNNHSTQHEMVIPIINKFVKDVKFNYRKNAIKSLKT